MELCSYSLIHYQILEAIFADGEIDFIALSRHFPGRIADLTPAVKLLRDDGLVSFRPAFASPPEVSLELTPAGHRVLLVHREAVSAKEKQSEERARLREQESKQDADKKAQQRFQNKILVAQALVPVITFILGLLVEHFSGVLKWLSGLFH